MAEVLAPNPAIDRGQEAPDAPLDFPSVFKFLFEPMRYKIAHGGRGGAKSWGFARALLVLGASHQMRIGCFREVQSSIKESVHQLLKDQIEAMGLRSFYEVLDQEIRGRNGTLFRFAGISDLTVDNLKSFEGLDVAWVEEAQAVSARSWQVLIPTIRKDNSEIWISMNPELDTDPSYVDFVVNPPEGRSTVKQINYRDNPFFPKVLEQERIEAKKKMSADEYNNVWLGHTRATVAGAIYSTEIAAAMANGQICNVPYDPQLRVHVLMDIGGWSAKLGNDSLFLILAQRHLSELRVIEAIQESHKTISWISAELKLRRANWGKMFIPHDGWVGSMASGGKSVASQFKAYGWTCERVPSISVDDGIRASRESIPSTYIDKKRGDPLVQSLRRYRRNINKQTKQPGSPVADEWAHGADCYRYLALSAPRMNNFSDKPTRVAGSVASYEVDNEMGL